MKKRILLKVVLLGVALTALASVREALAQGCTVPEFCEGPCPITCPFSPDQPTQKFDFGNHHFMKITANVARPFNLTLEFDFIDQTSLDNRLNLGLAPANCIPYAGATSNDSLGYCGFYHVVEPLPIKGDPGCTDCDYSGDVLYKVFWDFPTLDQLNNPRLYRAPIPMEDPQTCPDESNCFTQDITDLVYPNGDSNTGDPGIGGKGKGFSDYEVVDLVDRPDPCPEGCTRITHSFTPGNETNKYDFGTHHFIKITANVLQPFDLTVEFVPITQSELNDRLNVGLAPANCIPYDGATSNTALGTCGYYHIVEPLPIKGLDYDGDVSYKVFWDFPTLDQLHNVRLYRAPIPQEDQPTCANGIDCFTQDITGAVYAVGDSTTGDPGIGGKGKGFSDYEVVDLLSSNLTAKVKIGIKKSKDAGILFDLKAVVKRNGNEVSSGTLLGAPGGGKTFDSANLLTIPLSLPTEMFVPGDNISIKVLARNSCLASPQPSGVARLWYDDTSMSQVNEAGVPTLYLVRGDDDEDENCDHEKDRGELSKNLGTKPKKKRDVKVQAPVPSCDGPFRSFGTWSGTVPN